MKHKSITCRCSNKINTTENPHIAICQVCNRRYGRQAPKLKLLGVETVTTGFGVVIADKKMPSEIQKDLDTLLESHPLVCPETCC